MRTSTKNPQVNVVCERMHQTVVNVLRTLLHSESPQDIVTAKEFVDEALSIAMHAMKTGIHITLGSSSGSFVFNRDIFLNRTEKLRKLGQLLKLLPRWV